MLSNRAFTFLMNKCLLRPNKMIPNTLRLCSKNIDPNDSITTPAAVLSKYEPFRDDRSPIILDVEEERKKIQSTALSEEQDQDYSEFKGISPERGLEGVIDIEELVEILRRENAQELCVIKVPLEYRYVQYMVIVSGNSRRHMLGMAEFVRKVYKYKMKGKNRMPAIEGKGSRDWIALDLDNIAFHVFSKAKREEYDLESLWSVGSELDKLSNQPEDPRVQLLNEHTVYVGDLTNKSTNQ